jgi:O-antigen ligase
LTANLHRRVASVAALEPLAVRILPGVGAAVLVVALGLSGGGYLARPWRISTIAVLALAAAALVGRARIALGRLDWCFLGAFTVVLGWTAASALWWSEDPTTSWLEAERIVLYLACIFAVLVATERATVPILLVGIVAGVTTVSTYGLARYFADRGPLDRFQGALLFKPIGYANGFGIFATLAIVLAVGLVRAYPTKFSVITGGVAVVILLVTLYETDSRASWIALTAGVTTTIGFSRRTSAIVWGAIAAVVGVVVLATAFASTDRGLAAHLVGEDRPHYWRVAWKEFELHPFLGSGPGTFANYWLHYRTIPSFARDAHNLYLETLAEAGPLGLLILLAALAVPLLALRRAGNPITAAAAGAYVAFLVHAGVDWDWELPAVTVVGLVAGAVLIVASRGAESELPPVRRIALLAPIIGFAALALIRLKTGGSMPFGP